MINYFIEWSTLHIVNKYWIIGGAESLYRSIVDDFLLNEKLYEQIISLF